MYLGLYGSGEIAESYAKSRIQVMSYLNLDQSGYVKPNTRPVVAILTDNSTPESTNFLRQVVKQYAQEPQADTECGYSCTDHASWYKHGYPATSLFESLASNAFPYNDQVKPNGDPLDTLEYITFSHLMEITKAAVGYVVELSLSGL